MESHGAADRIAVMIDADNTRPAYADEVLGEVAKYGDPTIRRVYGDWTNPHLTQWARKLNRLGLRAMHQNAYTSGKNSTDLALVIDAMDLLYDGNVEAFALVTSDSDFTSLAHRLRESGKKVYVLGENKAPESLRNACDKFIDLAVVADRPGEGEDTDDAEDDTDGSGTDAPSINLQSALTRAVNAVSDDEGWALLPALGNQLIRTHPSFDARNFAGPGARLSTLITAQPYLETSGNGNALRVRLKGRKPARPEGATRRRPTRRCPTRRRPPRRRPRLRRRRSPPPSARRSGRRARRPDASQLRHGRNRPARRRRRTAMTLTATRSRTAGLLTALTMTALLAACSADDSGSDAVSGDVSGETSSETSSGSSGELVRELGRRRLVGRLHRVVRRVERAGRPDRPGDAALGHLQRHRLARRQGRPGDPPGRAARSSTRRAARSPTRPPRPTPRATPPTCGWWCGCRAGSSARRCPRWSRSGCCAPPTAAPRTSPPRSSTTASASARRRPASARRAAARRRPRPQGRHLDRVAAHRPAGRAGLAEVPAVVAGRPDVAVDHHRRHLQPTRSSRTSPRRSGRRASSPGSTAARRPWGRCSPIVTTMVGALLPFAAWPSCSGCRSGSSYDVAGPPRRGRPPRRRADMTRPTPAAPGVGRESGRGFCPRVYASASVHPQAGTRSGTGSSVGSALSSPRPRVSGRNRAQVSEIAATAHVVARDPPQASRRRG